ncbi:MAG: hypothetical protein IPK13_07205 [Deltaproteobacteria bacterium]|nr:hypothetical protein [Deltaproteobacteria bacterium]
MRDGGAPLPANRWYETVDIGLHVRALGQESTQSLRPERLATADVLGWFADEASPTLSAEGQERFSKRLLDLRRSRAEGAEGDAPPKPEVRFYGALDGPMKVFVRGFSRSEVRVFVLWATGASRWHHFFDLVADFQVARTADLDRRLGLAALEADYALEVCGVRHGMRVDDAIAALPGVLLEYPGQSLQFRRLYTVDCDVEIVVQDFIVKYLRRGDPGWLHLARTLRGATDRQE